MRVPRLDRHEPLARVRNLWKGRYLARLLDYLSHGGETALHSGYELGRRAVVEGLGCLEVLAIHQEGLGVALRQAETPEECARIVEEAGKFLSEGFSPFEISVRGFRDTIDQLRRNVEDLLRI